MKYPDNPSHPEGKSDYEIYAAYNHELPNNPRMVKNSPDYIMAMQKMDASSNSGCSNVLENDDNDPLSSFNITIYPNPAEEHINISFTLKKTGNLKVTLYNVLGKEINKVVNKDYNPDSYTEKIDISQLANGIYFCEVQFKGTKTIKKIVVDK